MSDQKPLWGGRFSAGPDPEMIRLTRSIGVDMNLLPWDCAVTRAHARTLGKAGLLDGDEIAQIDSVCDDIVDEWRADLIHPSDLDEDVHSLVERLLTERLGEAGRRIHAGRSRNDLVATDLRLWCRDASGQLSMLLQTLLGTLADLAEDHVESVMPGYTHLQRAQPVTLGFHLAAHGFALKRDLQRFRYAKRSADVSALGAGALAGTTLPLDPQVAATELGFEEIFDNATDAVSDRDYVCDLVYACSLCGVHLSRLAEEIVLWTSTEFSFARISDEWSTGSSMMPQKRNPDMAELIRGRAAGGVGDLTALLTLLKGLPLAYNRDLQEDKNYLFSAVERLSGCLEGMTGLLGGLEFDKKALVAAASGGSSWATDAAEALVREGVPFREAHTRTAQLVASLEAGGNTQNSGAVPGPHESVQSRSSHGGPSPAEVRIQLSKLRS